MEKVIKFKSKDEEEYEKNLQEMLEIVEHFKKMIEKGKVGEFIISYMDSDGNVEISANCKDAVGAIGIAEMSKQIIIHRMMME